MTYERPRAKPPIEPNAFPIAAAMQSTLAGCRRNGRFLVSNDPGQWSGKWSENQGAYIYSEVFCSAFAMFAQNSE